MAIRIISKRLVMMSSDNSGIKAGKASISPTVQFNIDQARKAFKEGNSERGLSYLEAMIGSYIGKGAQASAIILLKEADELIKSAEGPKLFFTLLKIAAHHYTVGHTGEAKAIFDRVEKSGEQAKNDDLWVAMATTFKDLHEITEAIRIANRISDKTLKCTIFNKTADFLAEQGNQAEAKSILLNYSVMAARSHDIDKHWEKQNMISQLLIAAEKLIGLEAREEANIILSEIIDSLPKYWPSMSPFDIQKREQVAVLMVKMGEKQKAIDLLTDGWFNEEYLKMLSPEEVLSEKIRIVDGHWKKLSQALKASG